jgi:hypothetical protein
LFSILLNLVAGPAAAYFSHRPEKVGGPLRKGRVMKKSRPPVSYNLEDGLAELRAMAADVLRKRAQTGGQAAIAALRKLGIAPGA